MEIVFKRVAIKPGERDHFVLPCRKVVDRVESVEHRGRAIVSKYSADTTRGSIELYLYEPHGLGKRQWAFRCLDRASAVNFSRDCFSTRARAEAAALRWLASLPGRRWMKGRHE